MLSKKKMKIALVWDWNPDSYQALTWKDGLAKAIQIIRKEHELVLHTLGSDLGAWSHDYFPIHIAWDSETLVTKVKYFKPDVILHWADCTRPNAKPLHSLGIPQALLFAGGNPMGETAPFFDHFFVESKVYKDVFERMGVSVSTAFGTNTELFAPLEPPMTKHFDAIFPATYCDWKRHDLFTKSVQGLSAITAGYMYTEHERYCYEETRKGGVLTLPHVSAETLRHLYASAKVCVIPSRADGGSQRTVLEAMAMNMPVIVTSDSDKTSEYLLDAGFDNMVAEPTPESIRERIDYWLKDERYKNVNTRDYILSKWTEHDYARAIVQGLRKLC